MIGTKNTTNSRLLCLVSLQKNMPKKSKVSENAECVELYSMAVMKDRGWTVAMVEEFLGEPDKRRSNPHRRSGPGIRLFHASRVLAVEQTPEFAERRMKAQKRVQTGRRISEDRAKEVLAWVDRLEIELPKFDSLLILRREAVEHYNTLWACRAADRGNHNDKRATVEDDGTFLRRITMNYLRHECTKYEDHLIELFGVVGADDARAALKDKINLAINDLVEHLDQ